MGEMFEALSKGVREKLERANITQEQDLCERTKKEVKSIKGLGPKAILEIEYVMSKFKMKFKKEQKTSEFSVELRRKVILFFIKTTSKINWGVEMRNAERLLKEYGKDFVFTIKPKVEVRTLNYFFNQYVKTELDKKFIRWKTPTLVEEKIEEDIEILDYKVGEDKVIEKPKTLKDFLS